MPRIYVASLKDYTHGVYHGVWIDDLDDPDEIMAEVRAMLKKSPTARKHGEKAEEWAIHDYEDFDGVKLGEYESFERVSEIAQLLSDWPAAVVAYYIAEGFDPDELDDKIRDRYQGEYKGRDQEAVADMLYDGLENREDLPEDIQSHISAIADSMAEDDWQSGEYFTIYAGNGTSYVMAADR